MGCSRRARRAGDSGLTGALNSFYLSNPKLDVRVFDCFAHGNVLYLSDTLDFSLYLVGIFHLVEVALLKALGYGRFRLFADCVRVVRLLLCTCLIWRGSLGWLCSLLPPISLLTNGCGKLATIIFFARDELINELAVVVVVFEA